ncbi:MAG TPA: hypothetical protein VHN19_04230 [Burkholderiales bacterium]|jgi:hypothetical protein|nr:hypothetical protein [Burkholderiales bacterium]
MEKRRGAFRRPAAGLIGALAGLACLTPAAPACELPAGRRLESGRLALSYRTVPASIVVGEPFEVLFALCPKDGFKPGRIKLDATMPEHRHGMNYLPSLAPTAAGYRSEGWIFHMPGRWEIVFEVGGERLADSVSIE